MKFTSSVRAASKLVGKSSGVVAPNAGRRVLTPNGAASVASISELGRRAAMRTMDFQREASSSAGPTTVSFQKPIYCFSQSAGRSFALANSIGGLFSEA